LSDEDEEEKEKEKERKCLSRKPGPRNRELRFARVEGIAQHSYIYSSETSKLRWCTKQKRKNGKGNI
jgi:hypothetical protein